MDRLQLKEKSVLSPVDRMGSSPGIQIDFKESIAMQQYVHIIRDNNQASTPKKSGSYSYLIAFRINFLFLCLFMTGCGVSQDIEVVNKLNFPIAIYNKIVGGHDGNSAELIGVVNPGGMRYFAHALPRHERYDLLIEKSNGTIEVEIIRNHNQVYTPSQQTWHLVVDPALK